MELLFRGQTVVARLSNHQVVLGSLLVVTSQKLIGFFLKIKFQLDQPSYFTAELKCVYLHHLQSQLVVFCQMGDIENKTSEQRLHQRWLQFTEDVGEDRES